MTPVEWLREYEREKVPMFDDPEFFDTYVEKFPIGMKRKYFFYELPYWEHLVRLLTY